jgi:protocatechuate 3,4-dioxygenase beta subunit
MFIVESFSMNDRFNIRLRWLATGVTVIAAVFLFSQPTAAHAATVRGKLVYPGTTNPVSYTSVDMHTENWSQSFYASSDVNGNFTFSNVSAGTYKLRISYYGSTYAAPAESTHVVTTDDLDIGNIELKNSTVKGYLKTSTGTALANNYVYLSGNNVWMSSYTNSDGLFGFYPPSAGTYTLSFSSISGTTEGRPADKTVTVTSPDTAVDVGTVKTIGINVTGKVVLPDGTGVANAYVYLYMSSGNYYSAYDTTDSAGAFEMAVPASGNYTLTVYGYQTNYSDPESKTVTIDISKTTSLGNQSLRAPNVTITVNHPTTSLGVQGVSVTLRNSNWSCYNNKSTDSSGKVYFTLSSGCTGTLTAEYYYSGTDDFGSPATRTVTYNTGDTLTITETLQSPSLIGYAKLPDGSWAANGYAYLSKPDDYTFWKSSTIDSNGRFKFDAVSTTGSYALELTPPWDAKGVIKPDKITLTLTAGSSNTTTYSKTSPFTFETAKKTVKGTVKDSSGKGISGANVYFYNTKNYGNASATTDSSGAYSVKMGSGEWQGSVYPSYTYGSSPDWQYLGTYKVATFTQANSVEESQTIDFDVVRFTATVKGKILKPDGTVLTSGGGVNASSNTLGVYGWSSISTSDGTFSMNLAPGTYSFSVYMYDNTYGSPNIGTITVEDGKTTDLGTNNLVVKSSTIQGTVKDSNGKALSGVSVYSWKNEGGYESAWTTTSSTGTYSLTVTPGTHQVSAYAYSSDPNVQYLQTYDPIEVSVKKDENVLNQDFTIKIANAKIQGTIQDSAGTKVTSIYGGWVTARVEGSNASQWSGMGSGVDNGSFTIPVYGPTTGTQTYVLSASLWNADYAATSSKSYSVSAGQTVTDAVIKVVSKDATVKVDFVDSSGNAVKLSYANLSLFDSDSGVYEWKYLNGESSGSLKVAPGVYDLSYWVDQRSGWSQEAVDEKVTAESGKTVTKTITLRKATATVKGYAYDPSGNPVSGATVNISKALGGKSIGSTSGYYAWFEQTITTDQSGYFSQTVPADSYFVTVTLPPDQGYINPEYQEVTVADNETVSLEFDFRASDATVSGDVTLSGTGTAATVSAWSETGGFTVADTDVAGKYTMAVTKDDSWHVSAVEQTDTTVYRSTEKTQEYTDTQTTAEVDLELKKESYTLPEPQNATFTTDTAYTVKLDDGASVEFPANSITSTSDLVTVTVTPDATLPSQSEGRLLDYALDIDIAHADGNDQGQTITDLSGTAVLTITYTDAELAEEGLKESDLNMRYYNESAASYDQVESLDINTDSNMMTGLLTHLTSFGIVTTSGTASAPVITMTSPEDGATVTSNSVTFEGTITGSPTSTTLSLNGAAASTVTVASNGTYSHTVSGLRAGENTITMTSTNSGGTATKERTITYQTFTSNEEEEQEETIGAPTSVKLDLILTPYNTSTPHVRVIDASGKVKASFFAFNQKLHGKFSAKSADLNGDGTKEIVAWAEDALEPKVRIFDNQGKFKTEFTPYGATFRGGLKVLFGDVDNDGIGDIITIPRTEGGANIRVYKYLGHVPSVELLDWVQAFGDGFRGETSLTMDDVTGDGQVDLLVAPKTLGGPNVRIYTWNAAAKKLKLVDWFMAYTAGMKSGVKVYASDINGDGVKDIITIPAKNSTSNLRIYRYNSATGKFSLLDWAYTFGSTWKGEMHLRFADFNGDEAREIIASPLANGGPNVQVYKWSAPLKGSARSKRLASISATAAELVRMDQFMAYDAKYKGGVRTVVADVNGNSVPEIVTIPNGAGGANVRIYEYNSETKKFKLLNWFLAYDAKFKGTFDISAADLDGDGDSEIVAGPWSGGGPNVRIYGWDGGTNKMSISKWFYGYASTFKGGVKLSTM